MVEWGSHPQRGTPLLLMGGTSAALHVLDLAEQALLMVRDPHVVHVQQRRAAAANRMVPTRGGQPGSRYVPQLLA